MHVQLQGAAKRSYVLLNKLKERELTRKILFVDSLKCFMFSEVVQGGGKQSPAWRRMTVDEVVENALFLPLHFSVRYIHVLELGRNIEQLSKLFTIFINTCCQSQ